MLARLRESIAAGEDDYLDATIKETLRARPVIVDVARKLTAPMPIGGYELPAGTFVMAAIAALHYREDLFPEPERVPPRALSRGQGRHLRLDPLRRRRPPLHRRLLRRIRDADRPPRDPSNGPQLRAPDPKPERVKVRNITLAPGEGARVVKPAELV